MDAPCIKALHVPGSPPRLHGLYFHYLLTQQALIRASGVIGARIENPEFRKVKDMVCALRLTYNCRETILLLIYHWQLLHSFKNTHTHRQEVMLQDISDFELFFNTHLLLSTKENYCNLSPATKKIILCLCGSGLRPHT